MYAIFNELIKAAARVKRIIFIWFEMFIFGTLFLSFIYKKANNKVRATTGGRKSFRVDLLFLIWNVYIPNLGRLVYFSKYSRELRASPNLMLPFTRRHKGTINPEKTRDAEIIFPKVYR